MDAPSRGAQVRITRNGSDCASVLGMGMTLEVVMPNWPKRFVLPYEPDYTAHRSEKQASRVTRLHLKAREKVQGPPIAPELAEMDSADPEHKLPRMRVAN